MTHLTEGIRRDWHVVYTRPRFERKVTSQLDQLGIEFFLPTQRVLRFWSDRRKYVEEPLFPCYVFVRVGKKERYWVLKPDGVVSLVSFLGQPAIVPEAQIKAVQRVVCNKCEAESAEFLRIGQRVRIIGGPLIDLTGYLSEIRGKKRFIVNIASLRKSLAVEVDHALLRAI